jgi:3-dehydroquinate synthetase
LGLVVEAALGERLGVTPSGLGAELAARLTGLGLTAPLAPEGQDEAILAAIRHDKKVRDRVIRVAAPRGPGRLAAGTGEWTVAASEIDVRQALGRAREFLGT